MSRALLLRGGRLLDPSAGVDGDLDLLISDGLVAETAGRVCSNDVLGDVKLTGEPVQSSV